MEKNLKPYFPFKLKEFKKKPRKKKIFKFILFYFLTLNTKT